LKGASHEETQENPVNDIDSLCRGFPVESKRSAFAEHDDLLHAPKGWKRPQTANRFPEPLTPES
jgi:hypothetical protein